MTARTDRRVFLVQSAGLVSLGTFGCGGADIGTRAGTGGTPAGPGGTGGGGAEGKPGGAGGKPGGAGSGAEGGATGGSDAAAGAGGSAGLGGAPPYGGAPSGLGGKPGLADAGATPLDAGACVPTRPDIVGPFFKPASPERQNLVEPGMTGIYLVVYGQVLDGACAPVTTAVLDFWQADDAGAYDNVGFVLRGHQRVDAEGRYELHTIVPGRYLNGSQYRPAHIHVKVYVGAREGLTTQLYFDGDPFNAVDPWFSEETMLRQATRDGGLVAVYDFVVR